MQPAPPEARVTRLPIVRCALAALGLLLAASLSLGVATVLILNDDGPQKEWTQDEEAEYRAAWLDI